MSSETCIRFHWIGIVSRTNYYKREWIVILEFNQNHNDNVIWMLLLVYRRSSESVMVFSLILNWRICLLCNYFFSSVIHVAICEDVNKFVSFIENFFVMYLSFWYLKTTNRIFKWWYDNVPKPFLLLFQPTKWIPINNLCLYLYQFKRN